MYHFEIPGKEVEDFKLWDALQFSTRGAHVDDSLDTEADWVVDVFTAPISVGFSLWITAAAFTNSDVAAAIKQNRLHSQDIKHGY